MLEDNYYPTKLLKTYAYEAVVFDVLTSTLYEFGGAQVLLDAWRTAQHEEITTKGDIPSRLDMGGRIFEPFSNSETGESLHDILPIVSNLQWDFHDIHNASQVLVQRLLRYFTVIDKSDLVLTLEI